MVDRGMVIIGAGEAGARAAIALRTEGWTKAITIIGEEKWLPYERPPLSKQQLIDDDQSSPVVISNKEMLSEHHIHLITDTKAMKINRSNHAVTLSNGSELPYERLLLTTGAYPRKLSLKGSALSDVLYLRTFADMLAIRERLHADRRVAVIGAGFIGLEVAASAVTKGCTVTVIEVGSRILMRGVPKEIADIVDQRHRAAGVDFKLGVFIESIDRSGDEYVISLVDGTSVRCDVIIAGIGAIPETSLAVECGLEIDNGVRVNELLTASDPDIFAAGDCCSFPHPLYEGKRIRLEAWRNARDQGTHVAGNMLGAAAPYTALPWFWSDQYEQTLQVAGLPDYGTNTVHRNMGDSGQIFFHLSDDGRLVSASGIGPSAGFAKEIRLAEMLVERQAKPDRDQLADATVKLRQLVRALTE